MKLKSILFLSSLILLIFACTNQSDDSGDDSDDINDQLSTSPLRKANGEIEGVALSMQYSSPGVKGRKIWDELVPYGEIWRTGADEATWIKFEKNVFVEGQKVPAGKYSIFTIPQKDEWVFILNKDWEQWGAFDYKKEEDLIRVSITPQILEKKQERMTFSIENELVFSWDKIKLSIKIEADKT